MIFVMIETVQLYSGKCVVVWISVVYFLVIYLFVTCNTNVHLYTNITIGPILFCDIMIKPKQSFVIRFYSLISGS